MATVEALEARVKELEREVSSLRFELAQRRGAVSGRTAPDFLEKFAGIFPDDAVFDHFVEHIERKSEQDRKDAEREPDETP